MARKISEKPLDLNDPDELEAHLTEWADRLERRLGFVPYEWRGPLVDVLDTYEICGMKLMAMQGFLTAKDCVALTELVMKRKAHIELLSLKEEEAREEP